jgi:L-amino acid N-acyltransferase YncA
LVSSAGPQDTRSRQERGFGIFGRRRYTGRSTGQHRKTRIIDYAHCVIHGTGTFETEVPDAAEMARRRADVLARHLPWLVAERGGTVLGYAYASPFRPRRAYRYCLEDSI